jgi:hypothetical protein
MPAARRISHTVDGATVTPSFVSSPCPDDDVAFLTVSKPGVTASLQSVTGAERPGVGQRAGQLVQVTRYPNGSGTSISCLNRAMLHSPRSSSSIATATPRDTSGSPLLAGVDPFTGLGTVIGVIGGYEEGGNISSVSYAVCWARTSRVLQGRDRRVLTARQASGYPGSRVCGRSD